MRTDERRGTEWCFETYETEGDELRLRFGDAGLAVTLHYRMREDIVERWVTLANDGPALELLRADSATWTLPERDSRLSQLHGRWAAESRLVRSDLTYGEKIIGSRRGHTGHQHLPWVALDSEATEESGEVYGCALGWSGSWRISVAQLSDARVQITGGAGYDDSGLLRLGPGESFTTPVFAGLWSDGGFGAASRAWHAYQGAYVIPDADQDRPVLFNSWEATTFDISEEQQGALARRAAAMGVELFVVDDGWFGARTGDRAGLGDWTPNPDRFPTGLKPLADYVHALGTQFGIWVEPEMVNPDSERGATGSGNGAAGGADDRVSDLNNFWNAVDVRSPDDLFATPRGGALAEYDHLKTYYVGYGANTNTTTRLRRYVGEAGVRPLIYDYTQPLLTANESNRVRIVSDGSTLQWWNNGRPVFDYSDPEPYTSGHFAFRTTWSHFRITGFRVWRLFNHS